MITLGVIFVIASLIVAALAVLWWPGWILIALGVLVIVLARTGRPVGGRSHWF